MLGRILLIVMQIVIAWIGGHMFASYVAVGDPYQLFLYALSFAALIYLTGVLGSQLLRGTATPSTAALSTSVAFAIVAALILTFGQNVIPPLPDWFNSFDAWVLAAALVGYLIRR